MAKSLAGKVALVTGGSSGIGRATALAFAEAGARIVVADVVVDGGKETVRMIEDTGGEGVFVKTDVTKPTEVEAMIASAVEAYGRLDCAFNNAGGSRGLRAPIHEYPEDEWDWVVTLNLKGVWLCMKYQIPQMLKQGSGSIVNTSSIYGLAGARGTSGYVAAKHGVAGLTKAAALEYAQEGIRVNAVSPGFILTPGLRHIFDLNPGMEELRIAAEPVGRMGTPEEIAGAVVWLSSDAASFVTGHVMAVDGGYLAQ